MGEEISRKKMVRQCILFAFFFAAVFFFLLRGQNFNEVVSTIASADIPLVILGFLLASVFHFSEGWNIKRLLCAYGTPVSFLMGFKYALTGFFFSSVSPGAVAGQPMQLYVMNSDEVSLSHGSLALLIELASFQTATFFFEILAVIALPFAGIEMKPYMKLLLVIGFVMNFTYITLLLILILSKKMGFKCLKAAFFVIDRLPRVSAERKDAWKEKLNAGLAKFHNCAIMLKKKKGVVAKVMATSLIQVICWFSVPYIAYCALGQHGVSFFRIFLLQVLIYMMTALLPLPGGMGISELAFVELFSTIYSRDMITAATLVSRGISFYFLLFTSGILMLLISLHQMRGRRQTE